MNNNGLIYCDEYLVKELNRIEDHDHKIDNKNYLEQYEDLKPFYDPYPYLTKEKKQRIKKRSRQGALKN